MPTTQQAIYDAIYAKLTATQTAGTPYALTEGRIYEAQSAINEDCPLIVFGLNADEVDGYFTVDNVNLDFYVDIYGYKESGAKVTRTIADAVYALLHRQSLTITGYTGGVMLCRDRGGEAEQDLIAGGETRRDAWRIRQIYHLWATGS